MDIRKIISNRIEDFFKLYDKCQLILEREKIIPINENSLNYIFKKILLENNRSNSVKVNLKTSILSNIMNESCKTRVLLISDDLNNEININQKLLFLMKRQNIVLDSISLGKSSVNVIFK